MAEPLRILMLAPTPYFADRGCHVRIFEEARTLRQQGHDVRIVTYHLGRDMGGIPTYRTLTIPWYGKLTAGPSWHKLYLDLLLLGTAIRAIRHFRPQLIHAHLHEGGFVGAILKRLFRLPLLLDYQGSLVGEITDHRFIRQRSILARLFSRVERWIEGEADLIIASSGPAAADLAERWPQRREQIIPFCDGVDTELFAPASAPELRKQLNIPPNLPLVVYLGVLSTYQGIDLLLQAVSELAKRQVPVHFLIMGFPEERYREQALQMGLGAQVTFTGRIPYTEAPRYLAAGDLAVSPKLSATEANGKLLNYLACGLPTVAFDSPVNRELLGDAALYATTRDAQALAHPLEKLLTDPELRRRISLQARERAVNDHSWLVRIKQLEKLYDTLLYPSTNKG